MNYKHFLKYILLGEVNWIMVSLLIGFFLGTIPVIKDNFSAITAIIVIISLIPGFLYSEDID